MHKLAIENKTCSCEQRQQSPFSPGTIADAESLYFVVVNPDHWNKAEGRLSNAAFARSKLWDKQLRKRVSIARVAHTGRETLRTQVIQPQVENKPERTCDTVAIASVTEIRALIHNESRAFCVSDDGLENFIGHGLIGAADNLITTLPQSNVRTALRQMLVKCFESNGMIPLSKVPETP